MSDAKTPAYPSFSSYSVQFGSAGSSYNPETVALVDEIYLSDVEYGEKGSKVARSIVLNIIPDATELFVSKLQAALTAGKLEHTLSCEEQQRTITVTPENEWVTPGILMRLLGAIYKQQAITFKDLVYASKKFGVAAPPDMLDTAKRKLDGLWVNPNPQATDEYAFPAPYFKFNPHLRTVRGSALVDTVELSLDRATHYSPYVSLHLSPKATDLFLANLQAAVRERLEMRQTYNPGTHNLTLIPIGGGNITQDQISRILDMLYETKAIAYNDQKDACEAFKITPPKEDTAKSRERRDLTGLAKS